MFEGVYLSSLALCCVVEEQVLLRLNGREEEMKDARVSRQDVDAEDTAVGLDELTMEKERMSGTGVRKMNATGGTHRRSCPARDAIWDLSSLCRAARQTSCRSAST